MTKKQKQREELAKLHEQIGGKNNEYSNYYRQLNRRIEKRKKKV